MDINLQISTPVLTGGEYFKTRYRLLPNGAYTGNTNRTNAPFTLTGLAAGSYVMEIIYVNANGDECQTMYQNFPVLEEGECKDFTIVITSGTFANKIEVSYTGAGTFPNGFDITYYPLPGGTSQTVNYNPLPASPFNISIPKGFDYHVTINGKYSDGSYTECFDDDIFRPEDPCTPMTITSVVITPGGLVSSGDYLVTLVINFTQSTPPTSVITIVGAQQGVIAGYPPATINWPTGILPSTTFYNGNFYMRYQTPSGMPILAPPYKLKMSGTLVDGCGVSHPWTGEVDL